MADLCLAFDPSSSASKAIYTLTPFGVEWLFMEPEVIKVPRSAIEHYEQNRLGETYPENQAWIELKGDYYALGHLARRFYGDAALKQLKYERAVYKVLGMVGAIALSKKLPTSLSLSLGILLPYSEYQDRGKFKDLIACALEEFSFRGRKYRVSLEKFNCLPEGGGILLRGLETNINLKQTNVLVVMIGYRNASFLLWEKGILARGETSELGFVRILERIQQSTSGLTLTELLVPVAKALRSQKGSCLRSLVKSENPLLQEAELKQLELSLPAAFEQAWATLSNWLQTRKLPTFEYVAIAGGTADYYRQELSSLWKGARINWSKNLEKQVIKSLDKGCNQKTWRYRLTDVYGYFFFLQQLFESSQNAEQGKRRHEENRCEDSPNGLISAH